MLGSKTLGKDLNQTQTLANKLVFTLVLVLEIFVGDFSWCWCYGQFWLVLVSFVGSFGWC